MFLFKVNRQWRRKLHSKFPHFEDFGTPGGRTSFKPSKRPSFLCDVFRSASLWDNLWSSDRVDAVLDRRDDWIKGSCTVASFNMLPLGSTEFLRFEEVLAANFDESEAKCRQNGESAFSKVLLKASGKFKAFNAADEADETAWGWLMY